MSRIKRLCILIAVWPLLTALLYFNEGLWLSIIFGGVGVLTVFLNSLIASMKGKLVNPISSGLRKKMALKVILMVAVTLAVVVEIKQ